jgi:hypothetical protein
VTKPPRPPINGWSHPKGDAWGKPIGGGSKKSGGCAITLLGLLTGSAVLDLLLAASTVT